LPPAPSGVDGAGECRGLGRLILAGLTRPHAAIGGQPEGPSDTPLTGREARAGLLRHMEDKHATMVTPSLRPADAGMERLPFCDPENFSSGYIMRSQDILFKQGSGEPWAHMLEYH
jgi:hypothetical protein